MIKLIVFDLWKTLAYKKGNENNLCLYKMMEKTGVDFPIKRFIKIFENSLQKRKWKSELNAYKNLCKNMKIEPSEKNAKLLIRLRDKVESRTIIYPHTLSMLKQLRKQGYKTGLISNTSIFSIKYIKKTGILNYIDYPVFSFDVGVIKPSLKAFRTILKKAKCKPSEAIMIGDKINDDVLPPRKIGMNSVHYKSYFQLKKRLKRLGVIIK